MKSSVVQDGKQFILRFGLVRTQKQIAQAYGISDRAVRYWVVDGVPRRSDGLYDLIEIQRWKSERKLRRAKDLKDNILFWQNKRMKYKALHMELKYLKLAGKLIRLSEVEKFECERANFSKSLFASFPRRAAVAIVNLNIVEMEAVLREQLEELLEKMASFRISEMSQKHPAVPN
jgi:hypothetical protein